MGLDRAGILQVMTLCCIGYMKLFNSRCNWLCTVLNMTLSFADGFELS